MMTERQITEFYLHASSLDKRRLEHQLEALRDYVPGTAEHRKAQKKAVAAMKSMNKYGDALHAWAEMLEEKENQSKEGKCLN